MSLSAAELQRLRDAHSASLTRSGTTCTVRRKVKATNPYGGANDGWTTVGTFPCRVMPERDRRLLEMQADRELMLIYYRLTVPHDTDIRQDDEVDYNGKTYQVVALWRDHDLRTARRAVIAQVA